MKGLIIVARESMLGELEELLHTYGIDGYTILNNVMGKGISGRVEGTFLHPDINSMILAVLPSNEAETAVNGLMALQATREKATQGQPTTLKVFTFSCEEHV
jgi:nitrogen regulatory protein PII